jgi:hypothetical protein
MDEPQTSKVATSIENPRHHVPKDVIYGLDSVREEELAALARQDEMVKLGRPNEEERGSIIEFYESAGQALGIDIEGLRRRRRDIRTRKHDRLMKTWESNSAINGKAYVLPPFDYEPGPPDRMDHNFWWARSDWFSPSDIPADARPDGLHFTGGISHHSGSLRIDRFGVVSMYELQWDRIPHPGSRRWRSTPPIELIGGIYGYTGDDDITTGDLWSKCWMHQQQTILQFGFGPSGSFPIVRGQASEVKTLIFEENGERGVRFGMPGLQWMPSVTIGDINPNSLWVHLEVRFDIQVEGHGSVLWMDPEVVIRTPQWPLLPLL